MDSIVFEKNYEIRSYDTGIDGKLRPDALLGYLQDIAGFHASILGVGRDELLEKNRFWALVRIICIMKETPGWNEILKIKTWPRSIERILAIRNFLICNEKGVALGEASSSWVIVDAASRRPLKPEAFLAELGKEDPYKDFSCPLAAKLPPAGAKVYNSPVKSVRYSDLDVNMHVNNAKYLQWVIDSYPLDFLRKHEARVIEANYNSESTAGEDYIVSSEEKGSSFFHSILKTNDSKESCRFRIEWRSGVNRKV